MKTSKFYQDQAQVTAGLANFDEKEELERNWLNAQWQTETFEKATGTVVAVLEMMVVDIKRIIADGFDEEVQPGIMGSNYRSAPAVAGRIQQRLVELLLNADLGRLTRAAADCKEAQNKVK